MTLEPPTFSMSADDTDIVEGMSGRLTVSASRPVSVDTEVMIVRDGTSSAGDDDYEFDPMTVTIEAREMSGHTLVEAVEDGTAEEGEVLTLFAVVDGVRMPDVSVSFRLWDAAVPALPFVAPLLLAAFLAIGGYRRCVATAADRPANARIWPSGVTRRLSYPTRDPHSVRGRP